MALSQLSHMLSHGLVMFFSSAALPLLLRLPFHPYLSAPRFHILPAVLLCSSLCRVCFNNLGTNQLVLVTEVSFSARHCPHCPPAGANWEAVAQYVDMTNELSRFDPPPDGTEPPPDPAGRLLQRCLAWWASCWRPRPLDGGGATAIAATTAGHGAAAGAGAGAGAGFAAAMGWVAGKGRQLVGRGPKAGGGGGASGGVNGSGGAAAMELGAAGLNGAAYPESSAGEGDSSSGSG